MVLVESEVPVRREWSLESLQNDLHWKYKQGRKKKWFDQKS